MSQSRRLGAFALGSGLQPIPHPARRDVASAERDPAAIRRYVIAVCSKVDAIDSATSAVRRAKTTARAGIEQRSPYSSTSASFPSRFGRRQSGDVDPGRRALKRHLSGRSRAVSRCGATRASPGSAHAPARRRLFERSQVGASMGLGPTPSRPRCRRSLAWCNRDRRGLRRLSAFGGSYLRARRALGGFGAGVTSEDTLPPAGARVTLLAFACLARRPASRVAIVPDSMR